MRLSISDVMKKLYYLINRGDRYTRYQAAPNNLHKRESQFTEKMRLFLYKMLKNDVKLIFLKNDIDEKEKSYYSKAIRIRNKIS